MTDRLLELAEKAGVAIKSNAYHVDRGIGSYTRPRLDIAHDLLAKMPVGTALGWQEDARWIARPSLDWPPPKATRGTFEECVIALAERALEVGNGPE